MLYSISKLVLLIIFFALQQWTKTWKIWERKTIGFFEHHVSQTLVAHRPRDGEVIYRKIQSTFFECGYGNTDSTPIRPKQKSNTSRKPPTSLCFKFATGSLMREDEYCRRWYAVREETQVITPSREERVSRALLLHHLLRAVCTRGAYRRAPNGTLTATSLSTIRIRIFRYAIIRDNLIITWAVKAPSRSLMDRSNLNAAQKCHRLMKIHRWNWTLSVVSIYWSKSHLTWTNFVNKGKIACKRLLHCHVNSRAIWNLYRM